MKKLIAGVLLVTVLFVGGYIAYTTWVAPRPTTAASGQSAQTGSSADIAMPTIVPAVLNKDGIPENLGSLKLTGSELGKDALNEFAQLHGQGFDLVNGYRGDYSDGTATATLWVGQAKDAATAQKLTQEMADKISAGNAMFTNLRSLDISDRTIYEVDGQGQLHFFYASNDKIVWLAADSNTAPDALHSIWSVVQ